MSISDKLLLPGRSVVTRKFEVSQPYANYEGLSINGVAAMQKLHKRRVDYDNEF